MTHANTERAAKRFLRVANEAARPVANTMQRGDRVYALAENSLSTVVGDPGSYSYLVLRDNGGASGIGAGQIAFGKPTGGGITGSTRFEIVDGTGEGQVNTLLASDGTQRVLQISADRADTGFGGRGFYVFGFNGGVMLGVANWDPAAGSFSRTIDVFNDTASDIFGINALAAEQQWFYSDTAGNPLFFYTAATFDSVWYDDTGNVLPANELFRIVHDQSAPTVAAKVPFTLASYTVLALPTPPAGGNGSLAWASNARTGAEGVGAGTGSVVMYKSAGPAGAGWYIPNVATLVTA